MNARSLFLAGVLFLALAAGAQSPSLHNGELPQHRNFVKVNVTSLLLKNLSGQYELLLSKKVSVAIGLRLMPATGIPFKKWVADVAGGGEDVSAVIEKANISGFAATPELRYYFGKGYGQGFYLAPYYRYVRFSSNYVPVNYTSSANGTRQSIAIGGDLSAHNGGLLAGAQWLLGNRFVLDWWIAGVHVGGGSGTFSGTPSAPLTASEQAAVRNTLNDVDVPLVGKTVSVTASRVRVDANGTFGGFRAGLNLGVRF